MTPKVVAREASEREPRILSGIRVIELASGLAGPLAGMTLGELGADVIKVEPPEGDYARHWRRDEELSSPTFDAANRNKRSVTIDLADKSESARLQALVSGADILLLDTSRYIVPTSAIEPHPRLIHVALIPQFTKAAAPLSELELQAEAGLSQYLGRWYDGDEPLRLGADVASHWIASIAVQAVLAALFERNRSGLGQRIVVSELGTVIALQNAHYAWESDPDESSAGLGRPAPFNPQQYGHPTADGALIFEFRTGYIADDGVYAAFHRAVGVHADWDSRAARSADPEGLSAAYREAFATWTTSDLVALIERFDGKAGPLQTVDDLMTHPQILARDMVVVMETGSRGIGSPWEFSRGGSMVAWPAPQLGEHSEEVTPHVE